MRVIENGAEAQSGLRLSDCFRIAEALGTTLQDLFVDTLSNCAGKVQARGGVSQRLARERRLLEGIESAIGGLEDAGKEITVKAIAEIVGKSVYRLKKNPAYMRPT